MCPTVFDCTIESIIGKLSHSDSAAASPARQEASPLSSVDQRILSALGQSDAPVPAAELRALCSIRKATFYARLLDLTRTGRLVRSPEEYRLANTTV